jgi:hypothetical protein
VRNTRSLKVSLDLLPGSRLRLVRILRELPMGTALTKEIPALVEGLFKIVEACRGVADIARVLLHRAAQLMFSIDHLANAREDVGVVHMAQPRERTAAACSRGIQEVFGDAGAG